MILGYARVSTEGQSLEAQLDALREAGIERTFSEKASGTKRVRPELERMIDQLRDGDVVVVAKYDRLSRSLQDLLAIVEAIRAKGAGFRSSPRTSTPPPPRGGSCSTSSPRSPSSSVSASPSGRARGWRRRVRRAGSAAGPRPSPPSVAPRCGGCGTWRAAVSPSWRGSSGSARTPCDGPKGAAPYRFPRPPTFRQRLDPRREASQNSERTLSERPKRRTEWFCWGAP